MERWMAGALGVAQLNIPCAGRSQPESLALFEQLVKRIYPLYPEDGTIPITIDVIPGRTVNAFATLGGHIYVFEGLLKRAQSADELAGVLAHEIEHVRNRHVIQGVAVSLLTLGALKGGMLGDQEAGSGIAYHLLTLKFSRQQEYEADEMALERLQMAHVDAAGFRQFFERAEKMPSPPQILSSHPANEFRSELAARFRGYPVDPVMDQKKWSILAAICQ
jgi:predicted Zn-dependent protease